MIEFECIDAPMDSAEFMKVQTTLRVGVKVGNTSYTYLSREDALKLAAWIQEQFDENL